MPRAYFIQFLNKKAATEEFYLDCLDLYQEFRFLQNAIDVIKPEVDHNEKHHETKIIR